MLHTLIGLLTLALCGNTAWRWASACAPERLVRRALAAVLLGYAQLVAVGQLLAALGLIGSASGWFAAMAVLSLLARAAPRPPAIAPWRAALRDAWSSADRLTRLTFLALLAGCGAAVAVNLVSALTAAPSNCDGLSYHLSRAAFALQSGNLNHIQANYWAEDAHPHVGTILLCFALGVLRSERLASLVQFPAYLGGALAVYELARGARAGRTASAMAAAVSLLVVQSLLESITPQNDQLVAFFSAAAVCSLLARSDGPRIGRWLLALCGMSLAVGSKASFVMHLPIWGLSLGVALWRARTAPHADSAPPQRRRGLAVAVAALLAVPLLCDAPGYRANWLEYHHPFAQIEVRRLHSFEGHPPRQIAVEAAKNTLRFGLDALTLDGLHRVPGLRRAELAWKRPALAALRALGIDLQQGLAIVAFRPRTATSDEDFSWAGILGFTLIPLGIACSLARGRRDAQTLTLLASGALFALAQAAVGPYDPWRGRYFAFLWLLWSPCTAAAFEARPGARAPVRWLALSFSALGALSGVLAASQRVHRPLSLGWGTPRTEQLSARAPSVLLRPLRALDALLPRDATVIACLPPGAYDYPLFGPDLTRRVLPIRSAARWIDPSRQPHYLVYIRHPDTPMHLCPPQPSDVALGDGWYLRRILGAAGTGIPAAGAALPPRY